MWQGAGLVMRLQRMLSRGLADLASGAIILHGSAFADSLAAVTQDIAKVLVEMEDNLITRDGIDMNITDWQAHLNSIEERRRDYSKRVSSHNDYCQGTFEEEEYNRRVAECASIESQLDTLRRQLQVELDASDQQASDLGARSISRATAYQQLEARMSALLPRLIGFCATMTPDERLTQCRLPPAPGPRTHPIVDEMSNLLSGAFGQ